MDILDHLLPFLEYDAGNIGDSWPKGRRDRPNKQKLIDGGGQTKRETVNGQKLRNGFNSHVHITISDWGNWILGGPCVKLGDEIESLVGGTKAPRNHQDICELFQKMGPLSGSSEQTHRD